MIKNLVRWLLSAIGLGALILFIWRGWGEDGNLAGFFLMLWDWFYMIISAAVSAFGQATGLI